VIGKLGSAPLPDKLAQDIRDLHVKLGEDPDFSQRAVARLLDPDPPASTHFGSPVPSDANGDYEIVGVAEDTVYTSPRWKDHCMYFVPIPAS
jgi:hypothetical protein